MEILNLIQKRHSARQFLDKPIDQQVLESLDKEIQKVNEKSGLSIQLVNDKKAFNSFLAHYGKFENVNYYLALVGKNGKNLEEKCGYYGEHLLLYALSLGLNSCWVALTYKKNPNVIKIKEGEKLLMVIALGYASRRGMPHKSKQREEVSNASESTPSWFTSGVEAALLAPTAMYQQQRYLSYQDGKVKAKAGKGFYTKTDLGIVKYHFEIGAEKNSTIWE